MSNDSDTQTEQIQAFWQRYLNTLPADHPHRTATYQAWYFGDHGQLADELLALVLAGKKTATASSLWEYEAENEPIPKAGGLSVILDGDENPACIIETTSVVVQPFQEVPADFAYAEGEDDRTLESWRREHIKYWSRVLPAAGLHFQPDMPVVCERFRVIYREDRKQQ